MVQTGGSSDSEGAEGHRFRSCLRPDAVGRTGASKNEKRFATKLQVLLNIDDDAAARIMDVITLK